VSCLERQEELYLSHCPSLSFVALLLFPLSFCSCSKLPAGLKERETMQLHVDLLAGAGHMTTNCELIFHFPKSFGQGGLLPASDLPSGF